MESWVKQNGEFVYRYDINRIHNTATMRIMLPDGSIRKILSADTDLLCGNLSETELMARGYQRT